VATLVLACYLETFLTPGILFGTSDKPGDPGGRYILNFGDQPDSLLENDTDTAGAAWLSTASVLKFRGMEGDDSTQGSDTSSPNALSPSTTLALQLRVPDHIVLAKNRSTKLETYCLAGALECNPAKHMVLSRDTLLDLIGGAVDGTQPVLARAWSAAIVATGIEHAGGVATLPGVEPPRALSHVHLLTNDELLGADVTDFLQGRGLRVTSSPDRSLTSLMQDYRAAIDAAMFWGTRGSTISANVVHARLSAGRPARTTVYWEDLVTKRG
jgi:hypothetical protein